MTTEGQLPEHLECVFACPRCGAMYNLGWVHRDEVERLIKVNRIAHWPNCLTIRTVQKISRGRDRNHANDA